jgi:hypothetical protein
MAGIDLTRHGEDVRRIYLRFFAARVRSWGIEEEDGLQAVYLGILARNRGRCPFDVKKGSLSGYIYMVAACVLSREGERARAYRDRYHVTDCEHATTASHATDGEARAEAALVVEAIDCAMSDEDRDLLQRALASATPNAAPYRGLRAMLRRRVQSRRGAP